MENNKQVQQDNNLSIYDRVRSVPTEALKAIEAGRLKGKSDINLFVRKDGEAAEPTMYNLYMETVPGSRRFTIR